MTSVLQEESDISYVIIVHCEIVVARDIGMFWLDVDRRLLAAPTRCADIGPVAGS